MADSSSPRAILVAALIIAILALALSLLAGCHILESCEERREVVESTYIGGNEYGDADAWEDRGWDCSFDGTIRDGFGRRIGRRWICTRCE